MDMINMFNQIDSDHSGEITHDELVAFMKANNFKEEFVDRWLDLFDLNNRGRITKEDFCERLGLEIDENMYAKIRKPRPSVLNLDSLDNRVKVKDTKDYDEFVDVDANLHQQIVHVSVDKPLATPVHRNKISTSNSNASSSPRSIEIRDVSSIEDSSELVKETVFSRLFSTEKHYPKGRRKPNSQQTPSIEENVFEERINEKKINTLASTAPFQIRGSVFVGADDVFLDDSTNERDRNLKKDNNRKVKSLKRVDKVSDSLDFISVPASPGKAATYDEQKLMMKQSGNQLRDRRKIQSNISQPAGGKPKESIKPQANESLFDDLFAIFKSKPPKEGNMKDNDNKVLNISKNNQPFITKLHFVDFNRKDELSEDSKQNTPNSAIPLENKSLDNKILDDRDNISFKKDSDNYSIDLEKNPNNSFKENQFSDTKNWSRSLKGQRLKNDDKKIIEIFENDHNSSVIGSSECNEANDRITTADLQYENSKNVHLFSPFKSNYSQEQIMNGADNSESDTYKNYPANILDVQKSRVQYNEEYVDINKHGVESLKVRKDKDRRLKDMDDDFEDISTNDSEYIEKDLVKMSNNFGNDPQMKVADEIKKVDESKMELTSSPNAKVNYINNDVDGVVQQKDPQYGDSKSFHLFAPFKDTSSKEQSEKDGNISESDSSKRNPATIMGVKESNLQDKKVYEDRNKRDTTSLMIPKDDYFEDILSNDLNPELVEMGKISQPLTGINDDTQIRIGEEIEINENLEIYSKDRKFGKGNSKDNDVDDRISEEHPQYGDSKSFHLFAPFKDISLKEQNMADGDNMDTDSTKINSFNISDNQRPHLQDRNDLLGSKKSGNENYITLSLTGKDKNKKLKDVDDDFEDILSNNNEYNEKDLDKVSKNSQMLSDKKGINDNFDPKMIVDDKVKIEKDPKIKRKKASHEIRNSKNNDVDNQVPQDFPQYEDSESLHLFAPFKATTSKKSNKKDDDISDSDYSRIDPVRISGTQRPPKQDQNNILKNKESRKNNDTISLKTEKYEDQCLKNVEGDFEEIHFTGKVYHKDDSDKSPKNVRKFSEGKQTSEDFDLQLKVGDENKINDLKNALHKNRNSKYHDLDGKVSQDDLEYGDSESVHLFAPFKETSSKPDHGKSSKNSEPDSEKNSIAKIIKEGSPDFQKKKVFEDRDEDENKYDTTSLKVGKDKDRNTEDKDSDFEDILSNVMEFNENDFVKIKQLSKRKPISVNFDPQIMIDGETKNREDLKTGLKNTTYEKRDLKNNDADNKFPQEDSEYDDNDEVHLFTSFKETLPKERNRKNWYNNESEESKIENIGDYEELKEEENRRDATSLETWKDKDRKLVTNLSVDFKHDNNSNNRSPFLSRNQNIKHFQNLPSNDFEDIGRSLDKISQNSQPLLEMKRIDDDYDLHIKIGDEIKMSEESKKQSKPVTHKKIDSRQNDVDENKSPRDPQYGDAIIVHLIAPFKNNSSSKDRNIMNVENSVSKHPERNPTNISEQDEDDSLGNLNNGSKRDNQTSVKHKDKDLNLKYDDGDVYKSRDNSNKKIPYSSPSMKNQNIEDIKGIPLDNSEDAEEDIVKKSKDFQDLSGRKVIDDDFDMLMKVGDEIKTGDYLMKNSKNSPLGKKDNIKKDVDNKMSLKDPQYGGPKGVDKSALFKDTSLNNGNMKNVENSDSMYSEQYPVNISNFGKPHLPGNDDSLQSTKDGSKTDNSLSRRHEEGDKNLKFVDGNVDESRDKSNNKIPSSSQKTRNQNVEDINYFPLDNSEDAENDLVKRSKNLQEWSGRKLINDDFDTPINVGDEIKGDDDLEKDYKIAALGKIYTDNKDVDDNITPRYPQHNDSKGVNIQASSKDMSSNYRNKKNIENRDSKLPEELPANISYFQRKLLEDKRDSLRIDKDGSKTDNSSLRRIQDDDRGLKYEDGKVDKHREDANKRIHFSSPSVRNQNIKDIKYIPLNNSEDAKEDLVKMSKNFQEMSGRKIIDDDFDTLMKIGGEIKSGDDLRKNSKNSPLGKEDNYKIDIDKKVQLKDPQYKGAKSLENFTLSNNTLLNDEIKKNVENSDSTYSEEYPVNISDFGKPYLPDKDDSLQSTKDGSKTDNSSSRNLGEEDQNVKYADGEVDRYRDNSNKMIHSSSPSVRNQNIKDIEDISLNNSEDAEEDFVKMSKNFQKLSEWKLIDGDTPMKVGGEIKSDDDLEKDSKIFVLGKEDTKINDVDDKRTLKNPQFRGAKSVDRSASSKDTKLNYQNEKNVENINSGHCEKSLTNILDFERQHLQDTNDSLKSTKDEGRIINFLSMKHKDEDQRLKYEDGNLDKPRDNSDIKTTPNSSTRRSLSNEDHQDLPLRNSEDIKNNIVKVPEYLKNLSGKEIINDDFDRQIKNDNVSLLEEEYKKEDDNCESDLSKRNTDNIFDKKDPHGSNEYEYQYDSNSLMLEKDYNERSETGEGEVRWDKPEKPEQSIKGSKKVCINEFGNFKKDGRNRITDISGGNKYSNEDISQTSLDDYSLGKSNLNDEKGSLNNSSNWIEKKAKEALNHGKETVDPPEKNLQNIAIKEESTRGSNNISGKDSYSNNFNDPDPKNVQDEKFIATLTKTEQCNDFNADNNSNTASKFTQMIKKKSNDVHKGSSENRQSEGIGDDNIKEFGYPQIRNHKMSTGDIDYTQKVNYDDGTMEDTKLNSKNTPIDEQSTNKESSLFYGKNIGRPGQRNSLLLTPSCLSSEDKELDSKRDDIGQENQGGQLEHVYAIRNKRQNQIDDDDSFKRNRRGVEDSDFLNENNPKEKSDNSSQLKGHTIMNEYVDDTNINIPLVSSKDGDYKVTKKPSNDDQVKKQYINNRDTINSEDTFSGSKPKRQGPDDEAGEFRQGDSGTIPLSKPILSRAISVPKLQFLNNENQLSNISQNNDTFLNDISHSSTDYLDKESQNSGNRNKKNEPRKFGESGKENTFITMNVYDPFDQKKEFPIENLNYQKENQNVETANISEHDVNKQKWKSQPETIDKIPPTYPLQSIINTRGDHTSDSALKILKDDGKESHNELVEKIIKLYEEHRHNSNINYAELTKRYLDVRYGPVWNVIIADGEYGFHFSYEETIIFEYKDLVFAMWRILDE